MSVCVFKKILFEYMQKQRLISIQQDCHNTDITDRQWRFYISLYLLNSMYQVI